VSDNAGDHNQKKHDVHFDQSKMADHEISMVNEVSQAQIDKAMGARDATSDRAATRDQGERDFKAAADHLSHVGDTLSQKDASDVTYAQRLAEQEPELADQLLKTMMHYMPGDEALKNEFLANPANQKPGAALQSALKELQKNLKKVHDRKAS
jgi:hypothetical protein